MRNRLLVVGSMCVLLLSVLGCSTDNSSVISATTEDRQTIIENAVSATLVSEDDDSDSASPVTEGTESAGKEAPVASTVSETPQVNDSDGSRTAEPENPVIGDFPKEQAPLMPLEDGDSRQEDTVRSEAALQEPEVLAPAEPPEPTEPPAPTEPPTKPQPKNAYDYPFDINVIHSDCIAIGESMGYTLNASLTPQNATWWNPVVASKSNQGDTLRTFLDQYIQFHTISNLGAYGLDEITEFNICCEANGDGYTIYFLFA